MKGIILAGGYGTRLKPLTKITNKHLLPVYNQPMIMHPLNTLKNAGIKEILIITGPESAGDFMKILGSGKEFGVDFTYKIQDEAGGIAQALGLAENFAKWDNVAVILGDNIYEDNFNFSSFQKGAKIFIKQVPDANRFGVPEILGNKIINLEEKPESPKSAYAVTGLYLFDSRVYNIVKALKPSARNELEIVDVLNDYIKWNELQFEVLTGFWSDAGTFPSLYKAAEFVKKNCENG